MTHKRLKHAPPRSVNPSVNQSICQSISLSVNQLVCLSISLSISPPVILFVNQSACHSACRSVRLSIIHTLATHFTYPGLTHLPFFQHTLSIYLSRSKYGDWNKKNRKIAKPPIGTKTSTKVGSKK